METGTPVAEVISRMGTSEQPFYRWKKVYRGPLWKLSTLAVLLRRGGAF
jgi:hypothetical protein